PVLAHVRLAVEGDGEDVVSGDLAVEDGVGAGCRGDLEAAVGREGLDHCAGDEAFHARLAGQVLEDGDRDGVDVGGQRAPGAVAAPTDQDREAQRRERTPPHARVTMLTRRLATTTPRSTARPWSHGRTRSSARARLRTRSSGASTSSASRPRTLPSTCSTTVTSCRASAAGSATGHGCWNTIRARPRGR